MKMLDLIMTMGVGSLGLAEGDFAIMRLAELYEFIPFMRHSQHNWRTRLTRERNIIE